MLKKATLNANVADLDTPAIPLAISWAENYSGEYGPLINLSQAVPNYQPHPNMLQALAEAAASPDNCGYGEIQGEVILRQTYADYLSTLYQHEISSTQTHITAGCNQAFFAALMAIAAQGDSILMSNPCYFNHEATARILGIQLRYFDCPAEQQFLPTPATIAQALDDPGNGHIKALALVSPNNPSGAIYPAPLLENIFQLCQQRGIWLLLDETYREFAPDYPAVPHTIFQRPAWQQHFIQLASFSKTYCIPGHRLGSIVAGEAVVDAVTKVMDNLQICAPRAAQQALAQQMPKLNTWIADNNRLIARRAEIFNSVMQQFPAWPIKSIGGYFAYVQHPYPEMTSTEVVKHLASEYGILPLPGSFFGTEQERYLRMAFANVDEATLHLLADRLKQL